MTKHLTRILSLLATILLIVTAASAQNTTTFELDALTANEPLTAEFADSVTTHLYAFHASAGDRVTLTMTGQSDDLDPLLVLFDTQGAVLAVDDDSGAVLLSALIEAVELEADGVYFVLATSLDTLDGTRAATDEALEYTLTLAGTTVPDDVEEPDTVTLDVDLLEAGASVAAESTADTPLGLFFFAAEDGAEIDLQLTGDFFTLLYLFDPQGQRVAVDPSALALELETDGVYLVLATDAFFYEATSEDSFFTGGEYELQFDG